jgi:predicted ester cyclase
VPAAPEDVVRRYYRLFNERRLDEAGQLVDPQAEFRYRPTRQRLLGRAGYRALAAMWLHGFEDARLEVRAIRATGPLVEADVVGHGTHTGDLVLGEHLVLPPTGQAAELSLTETLVVEGGRIIDAELDFDLTEMLKRLASGLPC